MNDKTFTVVCTGKGNHKRHTFNKLVVGDVLKVNEVRLKNMPEFAGSTVDGVAVVPQTVVKLYAPRLGPFSWRWKCPLCPADQRFTDDSLRAWLGSLTRREADISQRA
ncbi:hypothetical protein [Mycolicibacter kumamotonensis]|uniref:hypothetical protein n=1 Tax=Mycolicibacter kumamotonensis TaxID=354243 RepID=UPI0010423D6B|nr:hypothetical protein [Mycolicibacter kumamotonensis]